MPLPKKILELDFRAALAEPDLPPERRALLERGLRELQESDDEYPSDFAPAGEGWLSEQARERAHGDQTRSGDRRDDDGG